MTHNIPCLDQSIFYLKLRKKRQRHAAKQYCTTCSFLLQICNGLEIQPEYNHRVNRLSDKLTVFTCKAAVCMACLRTLPGMLFLRCLLSFFAQAYCESSPHCNTSTYGMRNLDESCVVRFRAFGPGAVVLTGKLPASSRKVSNFLQQ